MKKQTLVLPNKETLAYIEVGSKDKPVMVMLHGNMSSSVHYKPLIERFKDDYYIIAPDLRGFGDSTYLTPIESLEDFADDVKALCDALKIDQAIVLGWSTGGGIGLKLAAKYKDLVKKLVLIESASYKGYPIFEKDENFQPILSKLYRDKASMAQDPVQVVPAKNAMDNNDTGFMRAVWDAAIYNVKKPNDEDYNLYLSETLKQRNLIDVDWALMTFNMSHQHNGVTQGDNTIKEVICPVLSFYGLNDLVILSYMFEETVEALKNVETYTFENGSHSPLTDDPDTLKEIITNFLT